MNGLDITKGFADVDGQPVPGVLLEAMDATSQWPAVRQLRAWEREQLRLQRGLAVLDVGCGLADVTIDLAAVAGPGQVVAVDASSGMLTEASRRALAAGLEIEFCPADAQNLPFGDAAFDRVRSERTLQWLADPERAIAEMTRVLRPGGRIVVADTDWRTLIVDHPDQALVKHLSDAMATLRGPGFVIGGRLTNLLRAAGLVEVEVTAATHVWSAWDPEESLGPTGLFPLRMMAEQLASAGLLDAADAARFIDQLEDAARDGRFYASLTMTAVAATKP